MRILHVIPSLAACHGGPSAILPIMERALAAAGVVVETITTDDDGPGVRNNRGDETPRQENGVTRRYFPKQTEFYKVSIPLARWLKREVKNYDVVHIHALFSYTSIAAARAAMRAGVPYLIRPLGVLNQYGITQRRAFLKQFSLRWVEEPILRQAAAVHFALIAEREEAERLGIAFRSVVIPLGIEADALPPADSHSPHYVLYLSRIDPVKNIECLLDAWCRIHGERPDWRLVIAGSGDARYLAALRERACSLGLESAVEWVGQVAGDGKARLLADAVIFTLPSRSENFGIAAAEALMAGKPCVFTPGVAIGAQAAASGAAVLVDGNPESLASGLANLMDDAELRAVLSVEARRFSAAELSAVTMGRRLKELYASLISSARS
jgi:glycosyltransferase involved in cell wall biosynthesis